MTVYFKPDKFIPEIHRVEVLRESGWVSICIFDQIDDAVNECCEQIVVHGESASRIIEDDGNIVYECYPNNMMKPDCFYEEEVEFHDWLQEGF